MKTDTEWLGDGQVEGRDRRWEGGGGAGWEGARGREWECVSLGEKGGDVVAGGS